MKDFLKQFIRIYPNIPSHALWRAMEASLLNELSLAYPLLDLGCGDGNFAATLLEQACEEIHGCDKSLREVVLARSKGFYTSVIVADACHLPYKDCSFATVLSNSVLEHTIEEEAVISEISRVLRKDARFIFTVPSENFEKSLRDQNRKYIDKVNQRLAHFHYHSPDEWKELLSRHGLAVDWFRYYFPRSVQRRWEALTRLFVAKVKGRELGEIFGSRRTGLYFLAKAVFPLMFTPLLRPWASKRDRE